MRDFLKKHRVEILILGCSVVIVFALCLYSRIHSPTLGRDSVNYVGLSQLWHETGSIDGVLAVHKNFWFPPLSLFLNKLLIDCGLSPESAAVGLNIFLACFLPLIIFGIAKEVTQNVKIALGAAVLFAFNPTVITLAVEAQRDMPYLFFCGLMLYFSSCAIRREKWYYWLGAGVFFAFSFLIRYETLEMVPILGCYFIVLLIIRKGARLKQLLHAGTLLSSSIIALWLLLLISGTMDYVLRQYCSYYEDKCDLMQEKVEEIYE